MIIFPNAKINIGLNIISKRADGFHNIETVFMPIQLCDVIEIMPLAGSHKSRLNQSGLYIGGKAEDNLCMKAWNMMQEKFRLPPVQMHLHKIIPAGAGLGGGSSDASHLIKAVNELFQLKLSEDELASLASDTGSDCPFFIQNNTSFATDRGDVLEPISLDLSGFYLRLIVPPVHVSTQLAYSKIVPAQFENSLREVIHLPVENWREKVKNDFEKIVFEMFPEVEKIKNYLYQSGAVYAAMSGSGSSVYGIFENLPERDEFLEQYFVYDEML